MTKKNKIKSLVIFFSLLLMANAFSTNRIVNFTVGYKTVYFAGLPVQAIAVNNQIPGPTLHFKQGDHVTINVYNKLNQETAIHWHGIILPWQMDGVLGVSQRGIPPGGVFHYRFTLNQSGSYWYHAHAGLQEQQGLYGALIIDPLKQPNYKYTKDYTVVLSDWINTHPDKVLANLKKEGDFYSPDFPLQPSLVKFLRDYQKAAPKEKQQLVDDYKMMQQMRMSIYDLSDVADDAFLLNGKPNLTPWTASVKVGDVVRLRFVGATASTIFHVKIPNTSMQMVHVEGNDVRPYIVNDFTIAPGETFDVLVKIRNKGPYIIYAESTDTVGAAYGALITSPNQLVNYKQVAPFPEPLPVTREMMETMMGGVKQGFLPSTGNSVPAVKEQHSATHIMKSASMDDMDMGSKNSDHDMSSMSNEASTDNKAHSNHMPESEQAEMGANMPMDHAMSMQGQKNEKDPKEMNKKSAQTVSMNHSSSPAMQMSSHGNHNMSAMSNASMPSNMQMDASMKMNSEMHTMVMPTEATILGDSISPPNSYYATSLKTKYEKLIAAVKTNDPNKPVAGVINMQLFGYMDHYIWFINGVPENRAHPIVLEPGKRYRFVFTNISMMHHPMHLHGHWFILREGHGAYDPLLHTIDVPPGATITADVDTDASGQWLLHCHLLYHMMSGMARIIQYSTILEVVKDERKPQNIIKQTDYHNRPIVRVDEARPIDDTLVEHPMPHLDNLWFASFLDLSANPVSDVGQMTFKGLYGSDYNKLELFTNDAEINNGTVENADMDIFYWHLISQFWAIKGGVNYFNRPAQTPYWQPGLGIEGLMPFFIGVDLRTYYYDSSTKFDLELTRDSQITNNFFIRLGVRGIVATDTVTQAEIGGGLNQMRYTIRPYYRLAPGLSVFAEYEYDQDYGTFKNLQAAEGESASQNTLTFGLSMLF